MCKGVFTIGGAGQAVFMRRCHLSERGLGEAWVAEEAVASALPLTPPGKLASVPTVTDALAVVSTLDSNVEPWLSVCPFESVMVAFEVNEYRSRTTSMRSSHRSTGARSSRRSSDNSFFMPMTES